MEQQPSNAHLPPFFDPVRRRHPDVDIVLLPPEIGDAAEGAAEPVGDNEVVAHQERVAGVAASTWAQATDVPADTDVRLGYGPEPGTVVAKARILTRVPEGEEVVDALHSVLAQDGWRLGRVGEGAARFMGRREDLLIRVSYAEVSGGVLVDLSSDPMPVGTDRARELVRQ